MKRSALAAVLAFAAMLMAFGKDSPVDLDMVRIPDRNFEILRTEVTQELYQAVTGEDPSWFTGSSNPVEMVSWYDAIYFCNLLSKLKGYVPVYSVNGKTDVKSWKYEPHKGNVINGTIVRNENADGYRLPTSLEWGAAAKGGEDYVWAGSNNLDETGWFSDNSGSSTHPVGMKKPNGYGLYDMSGNVWEWCWDTNPKTDGRYERGGSWNSSLANCKISLSYGNSPERQLSSVGFRIVRSLAPVESAATPEEIAAVISSQVKESYVVAGDVPLMFMNTEVTQALYKVIMGENPSYFTGSSNPVEMVSWYDAIYFCNLLSEAAGYTPVYSVNRSRNVRTWNYVPHRGNILNGLITVDDKADGFRLPSAAEWEAAAKGGEDYVYSGSNVLYEVGWYDDNSSEKSHPVAQKQPDGYGLYDMSGNVWEWCWDMNPENGFRYQYGGGWNSGSSSCRINRSYNNYPEKQASSVGFRVVRSGAAEQSRRNAEEKARLEAEAAAERERQLEEQRKAEAEAMEKARIAAEEARLMAEKEIAEKAKLEAELAARKAEAAAKEAEEAREAARKAEAERIAAEQAAAEEARHEAEVAAQNAEKARQAAEKAAAEQAAAEKAVRDAEKARLEAEEAAKAAEKARLDAQEAEKAKAAEKARLEEEKAAAEAAEKAMPAEQDEAALEEQVIPDAGEAQPEEEEDGRSAQLEAVLDKLESQMVYISGQTFVIEKTEMTQEIYETIMGSNPSSFKGGDLPVQNVSWYDAIYFCNKLSIEAGYSPVYAVDGKTDVESWNYVPHTGAAINGTVTRKSGTNGYRLPEEAEWEYSAKGGSKLDYAGSATADDTAWTSDNSGNTPHKVATKKANGFGLYDMCGNVSEWCWDEYKFLFSKGRYFRGGSWNYKSWYDKISYRNSDSAENRNDYIGFRVVRTTSR